MASKVRENGRARVDHRQRDVHIRPAHTSDQGALQQEQRADVTRSRSVERDAGRIRVVHPHEHVESGDQTPETRRHGSVLLCSQLGEFLRPNLQIECPT